MKWEISLLGDILGFLVVWFNFGGQCGYMKEGRKIGYGEEIEKKWTRHMDHKDIKGFFFFFFNDGYLLGF